MKKIGIYSRKSKFTGKGDSIENQIEMCKEYTLKNLGNDVEFIIYEDEGFSGGTINRPEFKRLIKDIKDKKIDVLVCYRLDRISRNVSDFSSTLEILQSNNCSFISIREQFDTTSPMGRAMIYIASVFAQLERETIAERIKDNMIELAKNGRWTGGKVPLGFESKKIKFKDADGNTREKPQLVINPEEMEFVKFLYNKYLELGSLHKLEVFITENQIKSKNNIMYEKSSLKLILQNPVYVKANNDVINYLKENDWTVYGEADEIHSLLTYNKTEQVKKDGKYTKANKSKNDRFASVSSIEGFLEPELWLNVQKQFDKNRNKFPRLGKTHNALLVGKLKCGECKENMLIQHGKTSKVTGEKLFYYVCSLKRKSHKKLCNNKNAKAAEVESLVLLSLRRLGLEKKSFLDSLKNKYNTQNTNNIKIERISLEKTLLSKKNQIDTLVDKLSLADGIEEILLNKIKELKKECEDLNIKLNDLDVKVENLKVEKLNLELIEEALNMCINIQDLSREEQKKLIDILIDKIYWYGDGGIEIKFVGTDDSSKSQNFSLSEYELQHVDKLQFCSQSMTCI
ncbi:recombinase family protein [Clostridium septicum]|uniref:Recombinase family protein n=1 Tax=Clostridium septicum TaxID=1504 RepID=A0A9N7JMW3_CLOSE|nr:recombinase family protein [Clostridium septicum]AYE35669.1 recombinase family protein [Clostridium septicum]UEC19663.1 recombinase family protein [Clostridium septicum]USS02276.1 recombinase family protein [Clostridium septicum]WLF70859.1 recombinase family protein [Clostridium septicum]